jgi:hypothetical protein
MTKFGQCISGILSEDTFYRDEPSLRKKGEITPDMERDIVALVQDHMDDDEINVFMTHGQTINVGYNRKTPTREGWKNARYSYDEFLKNAKEEWRYDIGEIIDKLDYKLGLDFEISGIRPYSFSLMTVE